VPQWKQTSVLVLPIFNEGAYLTFKSIYHKALSLIVKSCSNPLLEPTSTSRLKELYYVWRLLTPCFKVYSQLLSLIISLC